MPDRELVDVVAFLVVSMLIVVGAYSKRVGRRNLQGTSLISQRSGAFDEPSGEVRPPTTALHVAVSLSYYPNPPPFPPPRVDDVVRTRQRVRQEIIYSLI